jgi:uncharacterized protein YdaT
MLPITDTIVQVDENVLHKANAVEKIKRFIDLAGEKRGLVKYASINKDALIDLFVKMLKQLDLDSDEKSIKGFVNGLSTKNDKIASIKNGSRSDTIKIVSKAKKDSHYSIDVSKDIVKHNGTRVLMISCYAKDSYLGRYLIKRNYFFSPEREIAANQAYDEIITKVGALKDRYYEEITDVSGIFAHIKKVLDGVISEIEFKDD